jgi:DNA-binding CsgD family transcriptional regulator
MAVDAGGFYEHERYGWTVPLYLSPPAIWTLVPWLRTPTSTVRTLHPGIDHLVGNQPQRPFAITDLVSEHAWLTSVLGVSMRDKWDRNHQFAIPVLVTPRSIAADTTTAPEDVQWAWVLGRTRRQFSGHDREVAAAVQPVLDAVTRQWLATRARITTDRAGSIGLTNRELAVLHLLSDLHSPSAIAQRLGISVRTTNKHLEHLYRKLDVHDRRTAIERAISLGIIEPSL